MATTPRHVTPPPAVPEPTDDLDDAARVHLLGFLRSVLHPDYGRRPISVADWNRGVAEARRDQADRAGR